MEIIIGFFIFCLVLFIYLHIQFHLKTGEDLEMYEVDEPSKEKLEEICDIRQPVLFDFDNKKIIENTLKPCRGKLQSGGKSSTHKLLGTFSTILGPFICHNDICGDVFNLL